MASPAAAAAAPEPAASALPTVDCAVANRDALLAVPRGARSKGCGPGVPVTAKARYWGEAWGPGRRAAQPPPRLCCRHSRKHSFPRCVRGRSRLVDTIARNGAHAASVTRHSTCAATASSTSAGREPSTVALILASGRAGRTTLRMVSLKDMVSVALELGVPTTKLS
jgi:hypothetical protein